ncbi:MULTISPECIES: phosphoenolpyruvate mutase [unclassified Schaalia]|uniref:phosphoenolpyruvate mutase n=1 Tax=unclassified Schaalia TaxID=2691889 RepID=UPI001E4E6E3D|nr:MULTISPECIES: phosphoenolpyruvate mutase [unclassified Schaalia]MCD4550329.1 phosphoenolpyruvate mutase [Schaalia sp. lx-260]MCD4557765.1 phosphoenolpyruvate mutase [Schaalia sp. lx-100]
MTIAYTAFCTDVIHEGHLNIIAQAGKYGDVVLGALSDKALIRYNKFPTISQEERVRLYESLEGVSRVIVQEDYLYDDVIADLKPDYVIHGDNWQNGPEKAIRDNVLGLLERFGGELVEISYTRTEKARKVDQQLREKLAMPEHRRRRLRQLLQISPVVKTIEAHDGLTGLIAEKTVVDHNGRLDQFDAMWVSSLCDSTTRGKPDIELVDMSARLRTIDDIMEVTTKPIILDGDTGGLTEHFVYNVRTLERMGVSAVIIEDKTGLKKNSLFGTEVEQTQAPIEEFCAKIAAGKKAQLTDDFMIIARIESLILERGMEDALARARAFVGAGADGIMIHSRLKDPAEIYEFCDRFREEDPDTPIVVVPTSFNVATEEELAAHGVNIVIYANQLIRAAFPAMQETARGILKAHRALEVDEQLMPFKEIITLIDEL